MKALSDLSGSCLEVLSWFGLWVWDSGFRAGRDVKFRAWGLGLRALRYFLRGV